MTNKIEETTIALADRIHDTFASAYAIEEKVSHDWLKNVIRNSITSLLEPKLSQNDEEVITELKNFALSVQQGGSSAEREFTAQLIVDRFHQELQKARETWLREEIVKLEGMLEEIPREDDINLNTIVVKEKTLEIINVIKQTNKAIQTIIDRYQKELGQPISLF